MLVTSDDVNKPNQQHFVVLQCLKSENQKQIQN